MQSRAARGRQLGLLTLLAMARGRPIARDRLATLLWPDASADRARPLLSDATYVIRSSLGEEVLGGSAEELWLNPQAVSSDAADFDAACERGDLDAAAALYAGPLLDGFYLPDSTEFEQWLSRERARLAHAYATVLSDLAALAEVARDWPLAEQRLRQLSANDPFAGLTAARLMRVLAASGNQAAALQHARVHTTLVREEFGTGPDAAVQEVLAEIEAGVRIASRAEFAELTSEVSAAVRDPTRAPTTEPTPVASTDQHAASLRVEDERPTAAHLHVTNVAHPPAASRHRIRKSVVAIAALALVAIAVGGTYARSLRASAAAPSLAVAVPRTIAVLPFAHLGDRADYMGDGLTDELISLLGRVDGLRVAARTSSFALRGTTLDARRIGDTLHVATLIEGSVRCIEDRVVVNVQLIDAATGYQQWSRTYDRRVQDIIAVQREIARAIVGVLQLEMAGRVDVTPDALARNPEAYDLYLRGTYARKKLTKADLLLSLDLFDRALRIDSTYAPAWAGKVVALGPLLWYGHLPLRVGAPQMREAASRAVALDDALPEAHVARGMTAFFVDWDWAGAERAFRRAIALNPSEALAHHFLANVLRATGRFDEMLAERQRAHALDPLSVRIGTSLGADYLVLGRLSDAERTYRRTMELEPSSPSVLGFGPGLVMGLGHVLERRGDARGALTEYIRVDSLSGVAVAAFQQFRAAFAARGLPGYWRARAMYPGGAGQPPPDPVHQAWMWARTGDHDRAIALIEQAYREHALGLVYLGAMPDFAEARKDPRVRALLDAMRLPTSRPAPPA